MLALHMLNVDIAGSAATSRTHLHRLTPTTQVTLRSAQSGKAAQSKSKALYFIVGTNGRSIRKTIFALLKEVAAKL